MVLKAGVIAYGVMGDAGSSLPTPEPRFMRDLWGSVGSAGSATCGITFVSTYAYEHGIADELDLHKIVLPVHNTRNLTKRNMKLNNYVPSTIRIDPQTYEVFIDDELINCDPVDTLPLTQRYYLF